MSSASQKTCGLCGLYWLRDMRAWSWCAHVCKCVYVWVLCALCVRGACIYVCVYCVHTCEHGHGARMCVYVYVCLCALCVRGACICVRVYCVYSWEHGHGAYMCVVQKCVCVTINALCWLRRGLERVANIHPCITHTHTHTHVHTHIHTRAHTHAYSAMLCLVSMHCRTCTFWL